ncbi:MAG: YncE family protein, partial [Planctomycetota bacterium]
MTRGTRIRVRWLLPAVAAWVMSGPGVLSAEDIDDDDWLGKATPGRPVKTNVSLLKQTSKVLDVTFAHLDFGKAVFLAPQPEFSDDGKYVYLLDSAGRLRKIEISTWTQVLCLPLATPGVRLRRAGSWLMVSTSNDHRHWLIDPATLRVRRKFTTKDVVRRLCVGPRVNFAYSTYHAYNLQTGRKTRLTLRNAPKGTFRVTRSVITPDGKH